MWHILFAGEPPQKAKLMIDAEFVLSAHDDEYWLGDNVALDYLVIVSKLFRMVTTNQVVVMTISERQSFALGSDRLLG